MVHVLKKKAKAGQELGLLGFFSVADRTEELFGPVLKAELKQKGKNLLVKTIFLCSLQTVARIRFEPEYWLSEAPCQSQCVSMATEW